MDWFKNLTLRWKLIVQNTIVVLFLGLVFIIGFPIVQKKASMDSNKEKIEVMNALLSQNLADPLQFLDKSSADILLESMFSVEGMHFVSVYDFNKTFFTAFNEDEYKNFKNDHPGFFESLNDSSLFDLEEYVIYEYDKYHLLYGQIKSDGKVEGYILFSTSIEIIEEKAADSQVYALLVTILFLIISAIITYIFSNFLVKNINQLVDFFKMMADGKGDLTKRIHYDSKDEIGTLSSEFNRFLDAQNNLILEITNVAKIVDEQIESIEALSNQNNNLMNHITDNLDVILSSVTSLSEGSEINVDAATNATDQSERSIELSLDSQKAVESSIKSMETIKGEVSQLESDMNRLHERSKQIQMISEALKAISDRTTILALNTSIEANKAGEYGAGFLIIADEIHRLADQSISSLDDINKLTVDIQSNLDKSYTLTKTTVKRVDEGMNLIHETGSQIMDSVDSVKTNLNYIREVSDVAGEQKGRVKDIVQNINNSAVNINQIKQSIDNTLNNVREQKIHIGNLNELMSNFKVSDA